MRRAPLAVLALLALSLGACAVSDIIGVIDTRVVAAKESPNTLVAGDGGRCTVSSSEFAEVRVGEVYTCAWNDSGP